MGCWVPSCGCALGSVDEDTKAQQGQSVEAWDQIQVLPAPEPTVRVTHLIFQPVIGMLKQSAPFGRPLDVPLLSWAELLGRDQCGGLGRMVQGVPSRTRIRHITPLSQD